MSLALKGIATTHCEILQTDRCERLPEVFEKELADQLIAGWERAKVRLGATTTCRTGRAFYLGGSRSFVDVLRPSASDRLNVRSGGDGRARAVILMAGRSLKAALASAPLRLKAGRAWCSTTIGLPMASSKTGRSTRTP